MSTQQRSNDVAKDEAQKALAALDAKRKALEMEAEAITSELMATPPDGGDPMGIGTPLVDRDGYPRGDIDVYRARTLRGRLAVIRTDHSQLMKELNGGLLNVASLTRQTKEQQEQDKTEMEARKAPKPKPKLDPVTGKWVVKNWDGTVAGVAGGEQRSFDNLEPASATAVEMSLSSMQVSQEPSSLAAREAIPFCKIDGVAVGSPAAQAGLKEGDLVVEFGTINYTNHRNLMAVGELVPLAAGEQRGIPIKIQRQEGGDSNHVVQKTVTLVPQPWSGRGLLGCHIVKYSETN